MHNKVFLHPIYSQLILSIISLISLSGCSHPSGLSTFPLSSKQILSNFLINDHTWGIYQKTDNTLYGLISLDADQHRPRNGYRMLGYWIGKSYWGKGIVVEAAKEVLRYAFEDLHCTMISIYHFPFNTQSKRVIEKLGFQYEGTLHDAYEYYDGTYFDEVCYYLKQKPS